MKKSFIIQVNIFFLIVFVYVVLLTVFSVRLLNDNTKLKEQNKMLTKEATTYETSYRECKWTLEQWNEWYDRHLEIIDAVENIDLNNNK